MSFILDALKKSQTSRQQQSGPGTIAVETAPTAPQPHNWQAIVIAIVVLNLLVIAVFAWYLIRDDAAVDAASATVTVPTEPAPTDQSVSADPLRVPQPTAVADISPTDSTSPPTAGVNRGEVRPLSAEVRESVQQTTAQPGTRAVATDVAPKPRATVTPTASENAGFLPTLAELKLDQRVQLSPLHIDVHVYNENPQRRFVLINARKYKEGERLSEGPLLEEIRRDGLVMYYRDQRFLVPRE